jgi:hypothetical protein
VEQSFALLHWFRRLRIRWEIRDDIHEAFLSLACGIIWWRRLVKLQLGRSSYRQTARRDPDEPSYLISLRQPSFSDDGM